VVGVQVRVGRLTFGVGSVQFAGARRSSLDDLLTSVLPVVVVVSSAAVLVVAVCGCWLQRRSVAARRARKLAPPPPTRTEYNVNYVRVSDPAASSSVHSDSSATAPPSARTDVNLPLTGESFVPPAVVLLRQRHWLPVRQRVVFKIAGLVHQSLVGAAPAYLQTTVAFCRTLVVAHCHPTSMTRGSCSCREHITNSVTGVSRPPVLDCGTTLHLDYGGRDLPSTPSDNL